MSKTLLTISIVFAVLGCVVGDASAGIIGPGAFGPGARVVDFNSLGLPARNSAPLFIDGDRYTTDDNNVRYETVFGTFLGTTGEGIGNDSGLGFIDIELAAPALRAGAVFGQFNDAWTASVSFFDEFDVLLGTVPLSGSSGNGEFAGWEADSGLIARIRASDTSINNRVLLMDDLMTEVNAVPEPSSFAVSLFASIVGLCFRRRRTVL